MRHRTIATVMGLLAALTLTACTDGTATPETVPDSEASAPDDGTGTDSTSPAASNCDLDLASTAFGPYTALNQIPTINAEGSEPEEDFWSGYPLYRFTIENNSFDPCADLSWVRLAGTTQADATEEEIDQAPDMSNAVVLFHRGELLTDPLPVRVAENAQVERRADNELEFTLGHYAPPGEAVTQELRTTTLTWEDDQLRMDDAEWYEDYASTHAQLDLTSPPPGSDAPVLPLGNVRADPFAEEYDLAEYPGSNFRLPLGGGHELRCILNFSAEQASWGWVGCLADGVEWPQADPEFGSRPDPTPMQPAPGDTANYLQVSYMPTMLASTRVDEAAAAHIPFEHTVPDDALTRIEHYVVDTRGDDVTISYGGSGVRIDTEGFESTTVHLLDQGRWQW